MLIRGRPKTNRSIGEPRELTLEDLSKLERPKMPAVKKLRDSHHAVARLVALGLRPEEVAHYSGYSQGRVNQLRADPAFQGLVEDYRQTDVADGYKEATGEYYRIVAGNRIKSARLIADKLEEAEAEDFSVRDLIAIHGDAADRTGYGKHTVHEHKVDLSEALRRAIDASNKVLEAKVIDITPSGDGERGPGTP